MFDFSCSLSLDLVHISRSSFAQSQVFGNLEIIEQLVNEIQFSYHISQISDISPH